MKKLITIYRDIANYIYIGRMIARNRNTEEWKNLGLRVGWFNTIYVVINLPPEVYEAPEDLHKLYVLGEVAKISDYFTTLNLLEVVSAEQERIERVDNLKENERVDAYLVTFPPILRELNLWWILKWVGIISLAVWAQHRFSLIQSAIKLTEGLIALATKQLS
jgi:hypothetical protein